MSARVTPPLTPDHRVIYKGDNVLPPTYQAYCLCGWESAWNRDYMRIEREGRKHIASIMR